MPVDWTPHRFSGGALALDVANTVVLRGVPDKCFDRFEDDVEIARFAEAASVRRSQEIEGKRLHVADCSGAKPAVIALRETTDALFRDASIKRCLQPALLAPFLRAVADGIEARSLSPHDGELPGSVRFETALGLSALSLLAPERHRRIRICANCGWLFLDRSRNGSRVWCDMAVCGNREKARRNYRGRTARKGPP